MATRQVISCDRCRAELLGSVPRFTIEGHGGGAHFVPRDLCPDCRAELESFLSGKPADVGDTIRVEIVPEGLKVHEVCAEPVGEGTETADA